MWSQAGVAIATARDLKCSVKLGNLIAMLFLLPAFLQLNATGIDLQEEKEKPADPDNE